MVMKIQRYSMPDPLFSSMLDLGRGVNDLFEDFSLHPLRVHDHAYPRVDVAEYDDRTEVVAELPGLSKEEVKISVHDGVLTLKGERKPNAIPENAEWIRHEIRTGEFTRTLRLPHEVKLEAISAELTNGVLRVVLPKAEEARVREIAIR